MSLPTGGYDRESLGASANEEEEEVVVVVMVEEAVEEFIYETR